MTHPLVTIGMPVFAAERHLAATIASVQAQTFGDFELILVDNNSRDRTPEICQQAAAADPRLRVVQNRQNLGSCRNYNLACELARGTYFQWVRSHDQWAPTYLARSVATLANDHDVVLCHARAHGVDADGQLLGPLEETLDTRGRDVGDRLRTVWTLALGPAAHGLVRLSAMDQTRRYLDQPGCDILFLLELATLGAFAFLDEPLVTLRQVRVETSEEETLARTRLQMNPFSGRQRHPFERHVLDWTREHLQVIAGLPSDEVDDIARRQLAFDLVQCYRAKFRGSFERTAAAMRDYVSSSFVCTGDLGYEWNAAIDDIAFGLLFLPDNEDLLAAGRHLDELTQAALIAQAP